MLFALRPMSLAINTVKLAFFLLLFSWYIFLYPFISSCYGLIFRHDPCKSYAVGLVFLFLPFDCKEGLIHSDNPWIKSGKFNAVMFIVLPSATLLYVFFSTFFSPFQLFIVFSKIYLFFSSRLFGSYKFYFYFSAVSCFCILKGCACLWVHRNSQPGEQEWYLL